MAAKTWSRTVGDANWSTAANWNGGTVPVTTDTVTFDATSVLACTVDNVGTFTGSITITAGYTGGTAIITQNVAITGASAFSIAAGTWTQAAAFTRSTMDVTGGTWTGASQAMSLSGTLTFSGGSLTMTSGTCTISGGSFTQTNTPTFSANGGTIAFTGGTAATLTGPNCTFNKITFNKSNVNFTVASGTTCPLGTDPTNSLGNTSDFIINGTVTWTGNFTVTRGDIVTAATTTITVSGTPEITLNDSLTFNAAATITTGIIVNFVGTVACIVTATAYTFGTCTLNKSNSTGDLTVAASTTIPFGTNPSTANGAGLLTINGTVTVTGTWTHEGNLTVSSTGTVTWTTQTRLALGRSLTIDPAATFPTNLPLTLNGIANTTITATATTFGLVTLAGSNVSTLNIAASTTITVADGGTWDTTGLTTVAGTLIIPTGTTITTANVTVNAGGTLTGPGTIIHKGGTFTMNAAATVNSAPNITMEHTVAPTAGRTFAGGGKTYGTLTRLAGGGGASATAGLTITGTNTFAGLVDTDGLVAHTWTFPNVTTTVARFVIKGSSTKLVTLARTGGAGTFTLTKSTVGSVVACDYLSISNSTVDASPVWYAGSHSTDGGGNTNWIFTSPPDKTWTGLGSDNNWSTALNWTDDIVPATTDAVFFNATSVKNCTVNNVGTWSGGALSIQAGYTGTITQSVAMTAGAWSQADGTFTQGSTIATTTYAISGGTFTGSGANISSSGAVSPSGGTLAGTVAFVITEAAFTATGVTITGATSVNMTFTGATGRTFAGGGKTYATLTRSGSGSGTLTITGTNTFTVGIVDNAGVVAHTIVFPNVTTTVASFQVAGSAGNLVTLSRTGGAGVFTLTKSSAGDVMTCDYLSISNSTVDASPQWFAGAHSTDGGGNTNWIFGMPTKMRKSVMVIS